MAEHVTDRHLTTDAVLSQELDLQRWAETHTHPTPTNVEDPQSAAVDAMAGTAGIVVVVGPAGTGKTTATARAVHRMRTDRRPVIGLAPSGTAADVLASAAHCDTTTVAGFLTRHTGDRPSPWPAGTTVILDEAGMSTTDDLHRLVTLAYRHRWRLVAVGDPAQLPAVGRGGMFAHWCTTIPHHELAIPRRFDHQWEADVSLALRTGDPGAVDAYDEHGRLRTAHPALMARQVAEAHQRHTAKGRTVAITTNTAETARAINTEIQRRQNPTDHFRLTLADGTQVGVGDRVATRRNDPALRTDQGERVRNRHTWTVTDLDRSGELVVSHPERGTVTLPSDYTARHVELGWAVTGYGNQGDTVGIGLAVLEPGTTRNHAYVALTRGRTANRAWIPDATGTLDPTETLAGMIAHTADSRSALATRAHLHRVAGLPTRTTDLGRGTAERLGQGPADTDGAADREPSLRARVAVVQRRLSRLDAPETGRGIRR